MFRNEKIKLTPSDKLTIGERSKTIIQWIKFDPVILKSFINQNRETHALSMHADLELKKSLNELQQTRNSERSS